MEVAAAASFAGLRSMCVMKQNGVNVASDFLLHLTGSGTRGGMILVTCDDPGALSSVNEGESRHFARLMEIPLLEPSDFQEAKEMTRWAFTLSEEIRNIVMVRSVTRMSHASGNVVLGPLPPKGGTAEFLCDGPISDPERGPIISAPVAEKHRLQQEKVRKAVSLFEKSPFNAYTGPEKPELLVITSSACRLYTQEAVSILAAEDRVGILKLGTTWPIPPALVKKYLMLTDQILVVEEVLPFLEEQVKILAAEQMREIGIKTFFGKNEGTLPMTGELNPDLVAAAIGRILGIEPPMVAYRTYEEALVTACNGFRDRLGIGIRQTGLVRLGPAGHRRLRRFDILPCGHSRPDQRHPSGCERHLHRPGQQRYGDDGIPVPPGDRNKRHGECLPDSRY